MGLLDQQFAVTRGLAGNAESQAPTQTDRTRIHILTSSPGDYRLKFEKHLFYMTHIENFMEFKHCERDR